MPRRPVSAFLPPLVVMLGVLAAAGCGGDDDETGAPLPTVRLELTAPADAAVVDGESVAVSGRVRPAAATVLVVGREATVEDGRFSADVPLDEGANVIDVAAAAPGRQAASTAVRVVREVPVAIPYLEGEDAESAVERLEALGLEVELRRAGGLFDGILPGELGVCAVDPEPGTEVRPGTTVTLDVARIC